MICVDNDTEETYPVDDTIESYAREMTMKHDKLQQENVDLTERSVITDDRASGTGIKFICCENRQSYS